MWLKEKKNPCEIAVKKLKSASFLNQFCTLCMNLHNPIDFELCLNKYKVSLRPIMRHNFTIISFVWDCCFNGNQDYMYLRDHFDFFIRHIYAILNTSYLTDSYISFTLKLESWQNFCFNSLIRSSTYGKSNIFEIPPCGIHFLLIHFRFTY